MGNRSPVPRWFSWNSRCWWSAGGQRLRQLGKLRAECGRGSGRQGPQPTLAIVIANVRDDTNSTNGLGSVDVFGSSCFVSCCYCGFTMPVASLFFSFNVLRIFLNGYSALLPPPLQRRRKLHVGRCCCFRLCTCLFFFWR